MATVLAALDNSLAANPVTATARSLARVLGARVEAVHVHDGAAGAAREAAGAAGLPLHVASGPVVEQLVEAALAPEVVAVVIGARGAGKTPHPLGSTALEVVTALPKPVVVVPPDAVVPPRIRRVLVPLQEPTSDLLTPVATLTPGPGVIVELIGRELEPDGPDLIPAAIEETEADAVVVGWAQALSPTRTPVVKEALRHAHVPVILIPVRERKPAAEPIPA